MNIIIRLKYVLQYILRRKIIFFKNVTLLKIWNGLKCSLAFIFNREKVKAYPIILKIDVTPYCHLKCPVCIHSQPEGIAIQEINKNMQMEITLFKKIVDEVSRKTWILSLQHLGEPLFNKSLTQMCDYARMKKINTFFVSNFSVKLSDQRIKDLLQCGVSWITVAMDGFSEDSYRITRRGGSVELVKKNLEKMLIFRKELGKKKPFIEVQSLVFKHNMHEKKYVIKFCKDTGVDKLTFKTGSTLPWVKTSNVSNPRPRLRKKIPLCWWPYLSGVILYNGDIVPCCWYRHDNAYAKNQQRISMGNYENSNFKNIYNNPRYQELRRYCKNPRLLIKQKDIESKYCYGCKLLFK